MGYAAGFIKGGFKAAIIYRFHFFVSLLRVPITLVIFYFLWKSVYSYSGTDMIRGMTFSDMLAYYVVSMVVGFIAWSDVDNWINHDVRTGDITSMFILPTPIMEQYFFNQLGMTLFGVFVEIIPILVGSFMLMNLTIPSGLNLLISMMSIILALLLVYLFTYLVGLSAFWLKEIHGLRKVKKSIVAFLEGSLVPLSLFPLWAQAVSKFLPFQYMRFVPIQIYLGKYTLLQSLGALLIQMLWIGVFFVLVKIVSKKADEQFTAVGI